MNEVDYYVELYRHRVTRMRNIVILLLTIFSLMLMNFWAIQWGFERYYSELDMRLYDFSQKYDKPLTEWWRGYRERSTSPALRSFNPQAIPFQNSERSDTDRGVYWEKIPLLDEYLAHHRPTSSEFQKFLGWELPMPLFFFVAFWFPSVLLLKLLTDAVFLRRTAALLCDGITATPTRLILQSIFSDRIRAGHNSFRRLRAAALAASLFVFASVSATLVFAPHRSYIVEGTLYLTPQFPQVSSTELPTHAHAPDPFVVKNMLIMIFANAILCAMIGRELARIKTIATLPPG